MTHNAFPRDFSGAPRRGFTLIQILMVVSLIAVLSAVLVGTFGRSRASVRRAECDVHLKEIVLAIDTYRQETARLPVNLIDLKTKGYLPLDALRCSSDPDLSIKAVNANYSSYSDFYVARDALDDGELPIIVCPFHEKDGMHGAQGFKGGYTKTFAARPATLQVVGGVVTVTRPGDGVLEIPKSNQLEVRGGDRIQIGSGKATLTFADASFATLEAGSEMSVLESYLESQDRDSIYTLVRQFAGTVSYSVIPGNKFDVATPTATAGALGTEFTITLVDARSGNKIVTGRTISSSTQVTTATKLKVNKHAVAFTCDGFTFEVDETDDEVISNDPANKSKPHAARDAKATKIKKGKNTKDDEEEQKKEEKKKKKDRDD